MVKISEVMGGRHLRAAELDHPVQWMIQDVRIERTPFNDREKPVVYFTDEESQGRGLILNKTNGRRLETMLGDETEDWIGKRIELYRTTTEFNGDEVPCIRVREPSTNGTPQEGGADGSTNDFTEAGFDFG